jgi:hypothetical protein
MFTPLGIVPVVVKTICDPANNPCKASENTAGDVAVTVTPEAITALPTVYDGVAMTASVSSSARGPPTGVCQLAAVLDVATNACPADGAVAAFTTTVVVAVFNALAAVAVVAVAAFPPMLKLVTGVVDVTTNGAVPIATVLDNWFAARTLLLKVKAVAPDQNFKIAPASNP